MDIQKVRDYWIEEAVEALQVARHLFEKGDYSYALELEHIEALFQWLRSRLQP